MSAISSYQMRIAATLLLAVLNATSQAHCVELTFPGWPTTGKADRRQILWAEVYASLPLAHRVGFALRMGLSRRAKRQPERERSEP